MNSIVQSFVSQFIVVWIIVVVLILDWEVINEVAKATYTSSSGALRTELHKHGRRDHDISLRVLYFRYFSIYHACEVVIGG